MSATAVATDYVRFRPPALVSFGSIPRKYGAIEKPMPSLVLHNKPSPARRLSPESYWWVNGTVAAESPPSPRLRRAPCCALHRIGPA